MAEDKDNNDKENKISPAQQKAESEGWKPETEWQGDPTDWVDYREFNVRGELMDRIKQQSSIINSQKGEIEEVKLAINDLSTMQEKTAEREYDRIMGVLKAQKVEAIDSSNGEAVTEIDEQIDKLKAHREDSKAPNKDTKPKPNKQEMAPEVEAFIGDPVNQWYHTDTFLRNAFNGVAAEIAQNNPSWNPGQVLAQAKKDIKKEMPHKFTNKSTVDGGDTNNRTNSSNSGKRTINDLTEDQQGVYKRFQKLGIVKDVDDYIGQLDAIGE